MSIEDLYLMIKDMFGDMPGLVDISIKESMRKIYVAIDTDFIRKDYFDKLVELHRMGCQIQIEHLDDFFVVLVFPPKNKEQQV